MRAGDGAVVPVDMQDDFLIFAVLLFGGGDQGGFDRLEDDFLVDILIAVDRIHDSQDFAGIHSWSTNKKTGTSPAERHLKIPQWPARATAVLGRPARDGPDFEIDSHSAPDSDTAAKPAGQAALTGRKSFLAHNLVRHG